MRLAWWGGASAPPDMGRANLRRAVHEIGEKRELALDIAFVPTAIGEQHRAGFAHLGDRNGGRGVAESLTPGDDKQSFEAGEGLGACGKRVLDAEGV